MEEVAFWIHLVYLQHLPTITVQQNPANQLNLDGLCQTDAIFCY